MKLWKSTLSMKVLEIFDILGLKLGKAQWIRKYLKYQYNKYFRHDVLLYRNFMLFLILAGGPCRSYEEDMWVAKHEMSYNIFCYLNFIYCNGWNFLNTNVNVINFSLLVLTWNKVCVYMNESTILLVIHFYSKNCFCKLVVWFCTTTYTRPMQKRI